MNGAVVLQGPAALATLVRSITGAGVVDVPDADAALERVARAPGAVDAVALDARGGAPVAALGRIRAHAPEVGIVLFAEAEQRLETLRSLRFATFATASIECVAAEDDREVAKAIEAAARRTRQTRALWRTTAALNERLARSVPAPRASEYLGRVLAMAPIGVVELDEAGQIALANPRALEILGLASARAVSLPQLLPGAGVDWMAWLADGERHGPAVFELARADGKTRLIEVATAPATRLSGDRGQIAILQDVTERVALEKELRRSERMKDEFIAMLAHELRNPLAPILTAVELVRARASDDPRIRRATEITERQVKHLVRMVDDLLDVSRISRGKVVLKPEPLELRELLASLVNDYRGSFEKAALTLEVSPAPEPLFLEGDATRLAQVVGNLLGNALKFTPAGGRVTLASRREGSQAFVTVRDTGIGMSPEDLAHIFQPFAQADRSLDRSRSGLGLGLAVAKGLVELHGGTIRAASEGPGRGSELTLVLPLAAAAARAPVPWASPAPARPRRVLVIEDNVDAAETLRDLLEMLGHEARVAHDGVSGLSAAQAFAPDFVLCDVGLPGMDGYAVARALRAAPSFRGRLVAVTGYGRSEDRERALGAGFDRHLVKPIRLADVQALLAT